MNEDNISLGRCLSEGWEIFENNMGIAILSYLLFTLITAAAGQFGLIYTVLAAFPLQGGLMLMFLALAKGMKPEIGTLFAGFTNTGTWLRWIGVGWLLCAYELLAMAICGIVGGGIVAVGIWVLGVKTIPGMVLIIIGGAAYIACTAAITIRWALAFFIATEGATATEAMEMSARMTEGIRFELFWILLVLNLISLVGMLVLCVGCIFTAPLALCMESSLYLQIKGTRARQADAAPA